jgi:hypothetical protein
MCLKCWLETTLEPRPVSSAGAGTWRNFDKFGIASLHTNLGFFRVTGVASTACKAADWKLVPSGTTVASPLIGLRSHNLRFPGFDPGDSVGTSLNTAGFDGSGFVKWDVQWGHPEINER